MSVKRWPELADRFPFHLAVIAEEISDDFEVALSVAQELGIEAIEFGSLWGEPLGIASQESLQRAKALIDASGLKICSVGPMTFKNIVLGHVPVEHIADEPAFQDQMWLLKRQLDAAKFLGAPMLRVYSFRREGMIGLGNPSPRLPRGGPFPPEMLAKVVAALRIACQAAEQVGVPLALENVRSCWANSGYNQSLILEQVNSPWLKAIWDPSNGFVSGEEDYFPTAYARVKPYMAHVQVKDAVVVDAARGLTRWERIGDGSVDFAGQLAALRDDGYTGYVSIETHWSPPGGNPEANTRATYAGLMDVLASISG
jgi:L-ribulose-5-phosphate 3-epimerase